MILPTAELIKVMPIMPVLDPAVANPSVPSENKSAVALWSSWRTWLLLIAALYFAGAVFSSSEESGPAGLVAQSASSQLAGRILPVISYTIVFILAAESFVQLKRALKKGMPFLVLCAFPFISSLWSQSRTQTLKMSVFFTLSTLFALWFVERFKGFQQMRFLMMTGFVAAAISILLCLLVPSVGISEEKGGAWQGMFYSKNHCGRMLAFLLIAAFHYPWKKLPVKWIYIVTLLGVIALSRSRTAIVLVPLYLVFSACITLVGKLSRNSRRMVVTFGLPIFLVTVTILAFNATDIIRSFGGDPTLNNRDIIWRVLLESGMKRPALGYGYCGFWAGTMSEGFNAMIATVSYMHFTGTYSHSGYIDIFLQLGIVGLVVLAYLIVKAVKDGVLCFLGEHRTGYTDWYIGTIVLSILYNVDEVTFMAPNYLAWMMFIMASVGLAEHLRLDRGKNSYRTAPGSAASTLRYRYA